MGQAGLRQRGRAGSSRGLGAQGCRRDWAVTSQRQTKIGRDRDGPRPTVTKRHRQPRDRDTERDYSRTQREGAGETWGQLGTRVAGGSCCPGDPPGAARRDEEGWARPSHPRPPRTHGHRSHCSHRSPGSTADASGGLSSPPGGTPSCRQPWRRRQGGPQPPCRGRAVPTAHRVAPGQAGAPLATWGWGCTEGAFPPCSVPTPTAHPTAASPSHASMLPLCCRVSEERMRVCGAVCGQAARPPAVGSGGHSRGPGAGVGALPGPVTGLRREQAEGAGVRLLGGGGEAAGQRRGGVGCEDRRGSELELGETSGQGAGGPGGPQGEQREQNQWGGEGWREAGRLGGEGEETGGQQRPSPFPEAAAVGVVGAEGSSQPQAQAQAQEEEGAQSWGHRRGQAQSRDGRRSHKPGGQVSRDGCLCPPAFSPRHPSPLQTVPPSLPAPLTHIHQCLSGEWGGGDL